MISNRPEWQALINADKFELEKARLSTKITETDIRDISVKNFECLTQTETPTLATVKKYNGGLVTRAVLLLLLDQLTAQFNFKNNLTDEQKETIAELILDDYYHFSIADIKLMFKMGIRGEFGQTFQNLDPSTVYGWCGEYLDRRSAYIFTQRQKKQKEEYKKEEGQINLRMIKTILADLDAKRQAKAAIATTKKAMFKTLDTYFKFLGKDPATESEKLKNQWEQEYRSGTAGDIPFELYVNFKISEFLLIANDKTKTDTRGAENRD